jgi:hypothetical protein
MATTATTRLTWQPSEAQLRRWLLALGIAGIFLGLLHHTDHVIRGNHVGWPLTPEVNPFTFSLLLYPLALVGLYMTGRGRLSAGYWLFTAVLGFGLLASTHLGPFALEPLHDITTPYHHPLVYAQAAPDNRVALFRDIYAPHATPLWAGVALAILFGLMTMMVLLAVTAVLARRVSGRWSENLFS